MPGPTIDQSFITKFNDDVHLVYQQRESKFRGLLRTDADVKAEKVRFQKIGSVVAKTKARNGVIPPANPDHSFVEATMTDGYVLEFVDQLDLTKLNIDVRDGYVRTFAMALARFVDDQIIAAMDAGATQLDTATTNMTRNDILAQTQTLDSNDVARDGRWFWALTPVAWSHMMTIDQFVNSDYVGPELPFMQGRLLRTYYGVNFFVSSRLPGVGTSAAKTFLWHMDAVGHGINQDVSLQWAWENDRQAWSGAGSVSAGAVVIDPLGLVEFTVSDVAALP